MQRPDILVLAAGGIIGEAWMSGVLGGLEDAAGIDLREARAFVGTSAGSIIAARLASGHSPRRPKSRTAAPGADATDVRDPGDPIRAIFGAVAAPVAALSLRLGAPAGALARAALLRAVPAGTRSMADARERLRGWDASFDGRLLICAVDRSSGRRVVFGAPGAPPAEVIDAVEASCAIPGVFAPVAIDGREYVDGGAWSLTNLDVAPAERGDRVLCLDPSANPALARVSAMGLMRTGAGARTAVEAAVLARRGALVQRVGPDARAGKLMRGSPMNPGPATRVHAAGYAQGRAMASA
jgi:NTE family protein